MLVDCDIISRGLSNMYFNDWGELSSQSFATAILDSSTRPDSLVYKQHINEKLITKLTTRESEDCR